MVLTMAKDAARVKAKSREARQKKARQVGYRSVRYLRFQGRRGDAMAEEVRADVRARRAKSIQAMACWLELQARANAEEGTPREHPGVGGGELLSHQVSEMPRASFPGVGVVFPGRM